MASKPWVRPPLSRPWLKRKADAISTDAPSPKEDAPGPKKVNFVPTQTPASPFGTICDGETWEERTELYNDILEYRRKIIKDCLAAVAPLKYNPTDLAENVALAQEMITAGIRNAMVWTPAFDDMHEIKFVVRFTYEYHVGTIQVLRALFPGIGVLDGRGGNKGWNKNFYFPAEFELMMGTEMLARVGFSFAELCNWVIVTCLLDKGVIEFKGSYCELREYPPTCRR